MFNSEFQFFSIPGTWPIPTTPTTTAGMYFLVSAEEERWTERNKSEKSNLSYKSQNHRMVGVGRDICGSSSPTPVPKQGHLQQAAQDCIQAGFEYLQRRRLHNLPGQPVPVLRHPQREEVLPQVQTELPVLQFVPIAPCPVTGHHWKESGPVLLTPTLQIFMSI